MLYLSINSKTFFVLVDWCFLCVICPLTWLENVLNDKTDFLRVDASESIFDLERVTKDIMAAVRIKWELWYSQT